MHRHEQKTWNILFLALLCTHSHKVQYRYQTFNGLEINEDYRSYEHQVYPGCDPERGCVLPSSACITHFEPKTETSLYDQPQQQGDKRR